MNLTSTPTAEKIMLTLRLSPDLYAKVIRKVYSEKQDLRGYSINQYLTDLIAADINGKKNK